uniref:Uncharacterized protein n=1 Tax=Rhipicephalus microplus TaxID=6941 RepID=A0A6M2DBV7_RHIMP
MPLLLPAYVSHMASLLCAYCVLIVDALNLFILSCGEKWELLRTRAVSCTLFFILVFTFPRFAYSKCTQR